MNTISITRNDQSLNELKKDAQKAQKKGLPFIMSSVLIWFLILLMQFTGKPVSTVNLYTFMCSCMLLPLSVLFSKIIKADTFRKSDNPISKLGFICTMNQMLYILIVMWAFNRNPEAMLMLYAMVFGAHLLPFGWVYDSKAYVVFSIADTFGALLIAVFFGNVAMAAFMIVMQAVLTILLFAEIRRDRQLE
ncbi:MAG: hypothetical protein IK115_10190 [Lachnospiraceae bacterium]|nr:hypothetical protein [Lachnospiraceae bacterium]